MSQVTEQQVMEALKTVIEPSSETDIVSLGMISGLVLKDGNVGFVIEIDPRDGAKMEPLRKQAEQTVHDLAGVVSVTAVLTAHRDAAPARPRQSPAGPAAQAGPGAGPTAGPGSGPGAQQAGGPGAARANVHTARGCS